MGKRMYHYATVSKALEELNKKGYTVDFNIQDSRIMNNPNDFEIQHIYRYEGYSNPDDEAIVYGLSSNSGEKGVYVAGFSAKSESEAATVLSKLCIERK